MYKCMNTANFIQLKSQQQNNNGPNSAIKNISADY